MLRHFPIIAIIFFALYGFAFADPVCELDQTQINGQSYMPFPAALKRGVNLSKWWEDDQTQALSGNAIHAVHDLGFDFVQLPVSSAWLEIQDPDQQKKKLAQLRCDIIGLLNGGLTIIVSLNPTPTLQAELSQHQESTTSHIEKILSQMQPVLSGLPSWRIYLNIYDRPLIESTLWWHIQGKIIDDLRSIFPANPFIATPGPFDGWWDLTDRTPYKDTNVTYGFNFFEPLVFTHHGTDANSSAKPPTAIIYPVDKAFAFDMTDPEIQKYVTQGWNRNSLASILHSIAMWKNHYNVSIVCLALGVDRTYVDVKSRYNWLRDARRSLDEDNIPWALSENQGSFGLIDSQGIFDKAMAESLGLNQNKQR